MIWQYRTILFEYKKDGLLGDRYIDDVEMENVLNEHGGKSWELVSVTPVQEGLLSFFKRPIRQPGKSASVIPEKSAAAASPAKTTGVPGGNVPQKAGSSGQASTTPSARPGPEKNGIGGIKIS